MIRPLLTALLGLALCLAGGTFDTASLYVPGVALLLLAVGLVAWVRLAASGATVERLPGPHTVVEEDPYPLRVEVRSGALPPPGGELLEPLLGWPVPIGGRWSRRLRINVRFARRGRRILEPELLVIRDPLQLHTREVRGENRDEVLVLPRVYPVRATAGGGDATPAHARAALIAAAETELDGLREHRPGSPASRIHWPAVARGHGLMERKLISEADSRPLVVLDPRAPASQDALDNAVRAAASLTVHFARRSGCSLLLPGDRRAHVVERDLVAWPAAHVRLALLDEATGPSLVAAQNRRGLVVLVAARVVDRPPRGLGRTPGGCVLVIPGALPNRRAVFEVAGCQGFLATRTGAAAAMEAVAG